MQACIHVCGCLHAREKDFSHTHTHSLLVVSEFSAVSFSLGRRHLRPREALRTPTRGLQRCVLLLSQFSHTHTHTHTHRWTCISPHMCPRAHGTSSRSCCVTILTRGSHSRYEYMHACINFMLACICCLPACTRIHTFCLPVGCACARVALHTGGDWKGK